MGALLRLMGPRAAKPRAFALRVVVRAQLEASLGADVLLEGHGARAFVLGTGDRVDVRLPDGSPTMAVIVSAASFRVVSLHADQGMAVLSQGASIPVGFEVGSVAATRTVRLGLPTGIVDLTLHDDNKEIHRTDMVDTLAVGEQLGFVLDSHVRPLGEAAASITGPVGGHAVPALLLPSIADDDRGLVLRSRASVHRIHIHEATLRKGVLIGRSRRCVLGRGFDENDGLSRVHAMVTQLQDDSIMVFDLASRYGLRDVQRPTRSVPSARLDDGTGCLVYGAGHLTWE
jgi:hypothetical protein